MLEPSTIKRIRSRSGTIRSSPAVHSNLLVFAALQLLGGGESREVQCPRDVAGVVLGSTPHINNDVEVTGGDQR